MRIKMLLCWVVGRWYQSESKRWICGLIAKITILCKHFVMTFVDFVEKLRNLIKGQPIDDPKPKPGDAIELITEVMKPAEGFDIPSEYNIHSSGYKWYDFLEIILGVIVDSECVYHSTRKAFLRAIVRGVYYFEGNAKKHLKRIDLYAIISAVLAKYDILLEKDKIIAVIHKCLKSSAAQVLVYNYGDVDICNWLRWNFHVITEELKACVDAESIVVAIAA